MRKVRNFDSELKALEDKTRALKERKLRHLGDLVTAAGADALDPDVLAGALLTVAETDDANVKEDWRRRGAAFFQCRTRRSRSQARSGDDAAPESGGGAASV